MSEAGDRLKRLQKAAEAASQSSRGAGGGMRVTILDDSKARGRGVDRIFDAFNATMDDIPDVLEGTVPLIRELHARVFETEGTAGRGAWAGLSARTIRERVAKGYGRGPILNRTGALEAHVLSTPAVISRVGEGYELRIEPTKEVDGVPKYHALAMGLPENNLPGRPMVAIGPQGAARFTSQLQRLLRARAQANGLR
jgi:hypothetical protein